MSDKSDEAVELANSGQYERAARVFSTLAESSVNAAEKIDYLVCQANCLREMGNVGEARLCIETAEGIAEKGSPARLQIDIFLATTLIDDGRQEDALEALSQLLESYKSQIAKTEFCELFQNLQVQRALILMHVYRYGEARQILEEARSFELLKDDTKSIVHCHLGRCLLEVKNYSLAKEAFESAQTIGIPETWEAGFHYHFGHTLYALGEFNLAKQEFILGLKGSVEGPPESLVYRMLAAVSRKLGDREEARRYEEKSKRTDQIQH